MCGPVDRIRDSSGVSDKGSATEHLDKFPGLGLSGRCEGQFEVGNFSATVHCLQRRTAKNGVRFMRTTENKELLILRAIDFAARKHRDQRRCSKKGGTNSSAL